VSASKPVTQLGRYEILAELGQGSMGVVYKARDPVLDRVVAVKTINLNLPKDELAEYEARFYQEARAAGGLNHTNIVTIYDIGKSGRVAYMAMEFLEGEELRAILSASHPLPAVQALDVASQVAEGLAYAHERHIVHRDIKPANIMVVREGLVKITDFGIARMRTNDVKTMTGMILGSPKYMSPEQVAGKRADHRSDLFSLGVVLYEMLTGQAPFSADSVHGTMYQVLHTMPPPPSLRIPELPEIVDLIVAKALAKNVEQRYQNAGDMASDLRDCRQMLQGLGVSPSKFSPSEPGPPPAPASSRREDKVLTIKSATARGANGGADRPALTLAKAFDSHEATMRLAAMTGMDKELTRSTDAREPNLARRNGGAAPGTTRQSPRSGMARGARAGKRRGHGWLWILSIAALLAAVALFVFR